MSLLLHGLIVGLLQSEDRKLYSSASMCVGFLLSFRGAAGSLHDGDAPDISASVSNGSTDGDLELRRQREWANAEETYGLLRPSLNEDVVYVHRQTTERFAMAPHSWDPIPVGHNVLPAEILEDIARWYNDIQDQWREITWWLCRVHSSSTLSAQPILGHSRFSASQIMFLSWKMTM